MDVAILKAKIKSKQLPSYLIFSGPEWKVQEIYINQIAKVTGKEIKRVDDISDIYSNLRNRSFVQKAHIYIVRDDRELLNSEKLQQQISSGLLGENILVHLLTNVDKRTKFYKQYKDAIIDFERLSDATLKKYILKEIKLSERNVERLIDICEHDYGRILLEIDKIKRYKQSAELDGEYGTEDEVFNILVKDGTIYRPPYDAIFDLVDSILDRNVNSTFDLLEQSYNVGESTMVMLSVLYNNVKSVLQVQTYEGNTLSKSTGLTGWQIQCAKKHLNVYTETELIDMLKLIQEVETGIKTGKIEESFAMSYILVNVL